MIPINKKDVIVPLDIPKSMRETYIKNYMEITKGSGRLMLFAGDQKVEHLNDDFYGEGVPEDDADPEHLFKIASQAKNRSFCSSAWANCTLWYGLQRRAISRESKFKD